MPSAEKDVSRTSHATSNVNNESQSLPTAEKDARRGWFADWDREATHDYGWQPCLETGQGHIPCFEVWFKTKAECEEWIAANVIGVEWFPGDPTETTVNPPGLGA